MSFKDPLRPYCPEIRGKLEQYLRERFDKMIDNSFFGAAFYYVMKEKNLLVPNQSFVWINIPQTPDIGYLVNSDYLLESKGTGKRNMSLIGAKKGIYNPDDVLKDNRWSISDLNL